MNHRLLTASSACLALALAVACDARDSESERVSQGLVGTWAHVVAAPQGADEQVREVIERRADGSFVSTFAPEDKSRPLCSGRWKITDSGTIYRYRYTSTECFRVRARFRPTMVEEQLFVVAVEPQRVVLAKDSKSPYPLVQVRISGESKAHSPGLSAHNEA